MIFEETQLESEIYLNQPQKVAPNRKLYSDRCAYYRFKIFGKMSSKFPDVSFTNIEYKAICVIYDAKLERFIVDQLTLSERYAREQGATPYDGFEQLASEIFATLQPPPEFLAR